MSILPGPKAIRLCRMPRMSFREPRCFLAIGGGTTGKARHNGKFEVPQGRKRTPLFRFVLPKYIFQLYMKIVQLCAIMVVSHRHFLGQAPCDTSCSRSPPQCDSATSGTNASSRTPEMGRERSNRRRLKLQLHKKHCLGPLTTAVFIE